MRFIELVILIGLSLEWMLLDWSIYVIHLRFAMSSHHVMTLNVIWAITLEDLNHKPFLHKVIFVYCSPRYWLDSCHACIVVFAVNYLVFCQLVLSYLLCHLLSFQMINGSLSLIDGFLQKTYCCSTLLDLWYLVALKGDILIASCDFFPSFFVFFCLCFALLHWVVLRRYLDYKSCSPSFAFWSWSLFVANIELVFLFFFMQRLLSYYYLWL